MTKIVTSGGEFRNGHRIIKAGRSIVNFFTGSPQRKQKLVQVVSLYDLPNIQPTNYPDTHVSFASKLFQTLIMNHYTFELVEHEDFYKMFNKFFEEDWTTMQEMEVMCSTLAAYAVNESQKSGAFIASLRPYYRLALIAVTNKKKFKVLDMGCQPKNKDLHKISRKSKCVADFTYREIILFA